MKLDIIVPEIFPNDKIISGVTKKNLEIFEEPGLTFNTETLLSDNPEANHKIALSGYLKVPPDNLKFQKQVHGTIIVYVSDDYTMAEADGMITAEKGIMLVVKTADCAAVLIWDPENDVVCALHSGWRGTRENIVKHGVERLKNDFHSRPDKLIAYISPCASGEKYEVGEEVAIHFPEASTALSNGKYLFDNRKQIELQLTDCGLLKSNMEISNICTISNEEFHSYRREGAKAGRMAAFIGMK